MDFSLEDRYRLDEGTVYLTGVQALVRTVRDRANLDRRRACRLLHSSPATRGLRWPGTTSSSPAARNCWLTLTSCIGQQSMKSLPPQPSWARSWPDRSARWLARALPAIGTGSHQGSTGRQTRFATPTSWGPIREAASSPSSETIPVASRRLSPARPRSPWQTCSSLPSTRQTPKTSWTSASTPRTCPDTRASGRPSRSSPQLPTAPAPPR